MNDNTPALTAYQRDTAPMSRQDFANVIALPMYQARRDLPAHERVRGVPEYDLMFPSSDGRFGWCSLPSGESGPMATRTPGSPSETFPCEIQSSDGGGEVADPRPSGSQAGSPGVDADVAHGPSETFPCDSHLNDVSDIAEHERDLRILDAALNRRM